MMRKQVLIIAVVLLFVLALYVCVTQPSVAQNSLSSAESGGERLYRAVSDSITSITFQQGVSPVPSYSGVTDTYIDNFNRDTNYGTDNLNLRHDGLWRILLRFDLEGYIPATAVV
ncbi:MAG: hypothetical protein H5T63_02410, partial [Chloroflexi bacterium]|nr:hypothetical protein [Chloroflexota bacterium]